MTPNLQSKPAAACTTVTTGVQGMRTTEQHELFVRAYVTFDPTKKPPSDRELYKEYRRQVELESDARVLQGTAQSHQEVIDSLMVTERALTAHKEKHAKNFEVCMRTCCLYMPCCVYAMCHYRQ